MRKEIKVIEYKNTLVDSDIEIMIEGVKYYYSKKNSK